MGTSHRLARTLPLAAAFFLLLTHALAQSNEAQQKKPPAKESRAKEAQTKETRPKVFCDSSRAVSLVETQLSEAKMFEDVGRRLSVMTRAADLLWPYERESSREIFRQAYDLAVKDFRDHENDPPPQGVGSTSLAVPRADQRFVVMTAIARRDPAWARQLAEAVAEEKRREAEQSAGPTESGRWRPGVTENTLYLAHSLLPVDRDTSIALARGTFGQPASYVLVDFLLKLAGADQRAGDSLYEEALRAYASRSSTDLAYLSVYPFALNYTPAPVPLSTYHVPPKGFAPSPRLRELFFEALFAQAESRFKTSEVAPAGDDAYKTSEHERLLTMLTMLEPQIARTSPALLERALALKAAGSAAASAQSRSRAEAARVERERAEAGGEFQRTAEQLEREPESPRRDYTVALLVMSARDAGEFARAEKALDKVGDAPLREKLASFLYFNWTRQALKGGQLDEAARLSKKVSELDYRARLSLEIAGDALKRLDDRARAAEILDAVAAEAAKAPDTPSKARALLGVAHLYTGFDATRASQVLREAVKVVNLLPDPDFSSETVGRELGNKVFTVYAMYVVPGMRLENAFLELGAHDFESALSAAGDLSDKYQRALAVLGLASKCLEDSAARPVKTKQSR